MARLFSTSLFYGRASVVVPLRPSSEHILIVRAPGAEDHTGFPQSIFLPIRRAAWLNPQLRASREHRFTVRPLREKGTIPAALPFPFSGFRACLYFSPEGGLFGLPLRASNEGLPRPRVARAQETNRLPSPPYHPNAHRCPYLSSNASASLGPQLPAV